MKMFLITLFFGVFGVHKFMHGKIGVGILYLFTVGLFGIGWVFDIISAFFAMFQRRSSQAQDNSNLKFNMNSNNDYTESDYRFFLKNSLSNSELLGLQQLILPGEGKLILNKNSIFENSMMVLDGYQRIIDDCNNLITTTANVETFFTRYKTLLDKLQLMKAFEPYYDFTGGSPSYRIGMAASNKQAHIKDLITRAYNKALIKADSLKTEKGKRNQYSKTFSELMLYVNEMTDDTFSFLKEKFKNKVDIKEDDIIELHNSPNDDFAHYDHE